MHIKAFGGIPCGARAFVKGVPNFARERYANLPIDAACGAPYGGQSFERVVPK